MLTEVQNLVERVGEELEADYIERVAREERGVNAILGSGGGCGNKGEVCECALFTTRVEQLCPHVRHRLGLRQRLDRDSTPPRYTWHVAC